MSVVLFIFALQDAKQQLEAVSARLSGTERALADANTRASELGKQVVLGEGEARLRAQELQARAAGAEDAEKLAKVGGNCLMVYSL